jgi:hypothetical protein
VILKPKKSPITESIPQFGQLIQFTSSSISASDELKIEQQ